MGSGEEDGDDGTALKRRRTMLRTDGCGEEACRWWPGCSIANLRKGTVPGLPSLWVAKVGRDGMKTKRRARLCSASGVRTLCPVA